MLKIYIKICIFVLIDIKTHYVDEAKRSLTIRRGNEIRFSDIFVFWIIINN